MSVPDLPRRFVIRESSHRIHNALSPQKLARLGELLQLGPAHRLLDLACGSGEALATWSLAHGIGGVGVDLSTAFVAKARARAVELGVEDRVEFVHADASAWVAPAPVDVACCLGATWIGGGVAGTIDLLQRSLTTSGLVVIGEPYWVRVPRTPEAVAGCHVDSADEFTTLPELVASFATYGYDVVQLVLAEPDDWDLYHGRQWWNLRRWLDENPDDPDWPDVRAELDRAPLEHVTHYRDHVGWGVFVLQRR